MKKTALSLWAIMAISSLGFAGGGVNLATEPVIDVPLAEEVFDSSIYAGLGFSVASTRQSQLGFFDNLEQSGRLDRTAEISLSAGYAFNPYIAVESRYMFSFSHEDVLKRRAWGVYLKPQYPVYEKINVYALLGYGGVKATGIDGWNINVDNTGFQWGGGIGYNTTDKMTFFIDYLKMDDNVKSRFVSCSNVDSDVITAGVLYQF